MIEPVVEILAILLLAAVVSVLLIALAVAGVLGLLALRVVRKAHRVVGWLRWPKPEKRKNDPEKSEGVKVEDEKPDLRVLV